MSTALYQVSRIPFDGDDPEQALQEHLANVPRYLRLVEVAARDDGWTVIYEDEEARMPGQSSLAEQG